MTFDRQSWSVRPAESGPVRLLIADDHPLIREGLRRVLLTTGERWVVQDCANGFEAIEHLRRETFDVLVTDLSMPGMGGLDLIKRVRHELPAIRVLVLSMHAEEQYALRAYRSGAHGYLCKDAAGRELVTAISRIMSGRMYVPTDLVDTIFMQLGGGVAGGKDAVLTDRELEVLRRFVHGQRPSDIAAAMCISVKTVSSHKSRILEKLHLPTTAAMIRYGVELDIDGAHGTTGLPGRASGGDSSGAAR